MSKRRLRDNDVFKSKVIMSSFIMKTEKVTVVILRKRWKRLDKVIFRSTRTKDFSPIRKRKEGQRGDKSKNYRGLKDIIDLRVVQDDLK